MSRFFKSFLVGLFLITLSGNYLIAGILTPQDSVKLILLDELRSGRSQNKSRVNFKVDENVTDKDGEIVIRKGTPAFGTVIRSRAAGAWGRRGIIEVEVNYTTAVDGQRVDLRANKTKAGNKNKRLITSGAWLVAWPLAFLRGKNVVIKSGSNIIAWVDSNLTINIKKTADVTNDKNVEPQSEWPDKFTLKNGDVIVGKMQQFKNGAYRVHTAAGDFTLKASDVESVLNNCKSETVVEERTNENESLNLGDKTPIFNKSGKLIGSKKQIGNSWLFYNLKGNRLTTDQAQTMGLK